MPPLLRLSGKQIIALGFVMVLLGAVVPWLMLPRIAVLQPSFWLFFLSYGVSLTGLILGIIGAAMLGLDRRKRDK